MVISLLATLRIVLVNLAATLMCDVGTTKADANTAKQLIDSTTAMEIGAALERFNLIAGLRDRVPYIID